MGKPKPCSNPITKENKIYIMQKFILNTCKFSLKKALVRASAT